MSSTMTGLTCNLGVRKAASDTLCFECWSHGKIDRVTKKDIPGTWGTHRCYEVKGHLGACLCACGAVMPERTVK